MPMSLLGTREKAEMMGLYDRFLRLGAFPELVNITNAPVLCNKNRKHELYFIKSF